MYYFEGCPGLSIVDHDGRKRCFVVISSTQMLHNKNFSYNDLRQTCFALGGQMPQLKSITDEKLLKEELQQYSFDSVCECMVSFLSSHFVSHL